MRIFKQAVVLSLLFVFILAVGVLADSNSNVVGMEFKDAPLVDVFQILGEIDGMNVLVDPSVSGTVSFYLKDLTVIEALDLVARTTGYSYEIIGNTLVVSTAERLRAEFTTDEFAFFTIKHADVSSTIELINIIVPSVKIHSDIQRSLIAVYGSKSELEVVSNLIEQYERVFPETEQVLEDEEEEEVAKKDSLQVNQIVINYIDGEDIYQSKQQLFPNRNFNWNARINTFSGTTTANEWEQIKQIIRQKDFPDFTLRGFVASEDSDFVLVEYQGNTMLTKVGEYFYGWQLVDLQAKQATFSKDDRQFTVAMRR